MSFVDIHHSIINAFLGVTRYTNRPMLDLLKTYIIRFSMKHTMGPHKNPCITKMYIETFIRSICRYTSLIKLCLLGSHLMFKQVNVIFC